MALYQFDPYIQLRGAEAHIIKNLEAEREQLRQEAASSFGGAALSGLAGLGSALLAIRKGKAQATAKQLARQIVGLFGATSGAIASGSYLAKALESRRKAKRLGQQISTARELYKERYGILPESAIKPGDRPYFSEFYRLQTKQLPKVVKVGP